MAVDYDNDLLLITAASGKQSSHLLPLLKQWKRIRLLASSKESRDRLAKQYPNAEVIQADMADPHACKKLLDGVTACFLVTPGFNPQETYCGYNIIDAARTQLPQHGGNFQHLVYSSVIFPEKSLLVNHDAKRYVQEHLIQSEVPYTIVQPTVLMENVPIAKLINEESPVHPMLWNPSTAFSFVSCRDVGQAAANILSQREKHFYATYQLVGTPSPLNFNEAMSIISSEIGKSVKIEQKSIEEGVKIFSGVMTKGQPEKAAFETTQGVARMFLYYNQKGLIGNANVLEMLLGRKPLGYRDWVKANVKESA